MTTYALSALAILTLGGAAAPSTALAGGTWHWTDGYEGQLDLDRIKDRVESRLDDLKSGDRGEELPSAHDNDQPEASNPWEALSPTDLWSSFLVYWQGSF